MVEAGRGVSEKWAYDIAGTGTFESNILAAHALYRRVVKEGRGAVSTVPGGEQLLKLLWNSMYDQVGKRHLGHHLDGLVALSISLLLFPSAREWLDCGVWAATSMHDVVGELIVYIGIGSIIMQ